MSLKMFSIWVRNERTGELTCFTGQGERLKEAVDDGVKNIESAFRPSSSGGARPGAGIGVPARLGVRLASGETVLRELRAFEGDTPYDPATEKRDPPDCEIPKHLLEPRPRQGAMSFAEKIPDDAATHASGEGKGKPEGELELA